MNEIEKLIKEKSVPGAYYPAIKLDEAEKACIKMFEEYVKKKPIGVTVEVLKSLGYNIPDFEVRI